MATVRHAFDSAKDDPADTSVVGASKWDADHDLEDVASQTDLGFENPDWYGALGDGTTDDTDAFVEARNAAGVGGSLRMGGKVYRVADVEPLSGQVWSGVGRSTVLKAATGATQAVLMEGLLHNTLRDFLIDGNAKASKGLVIQGSAVASSQGHHFDGVKFQNCSVGTHAAQGTVSQVDKNLYTDCHWADNDDGLWIDSVNAQEQLLIGGSFDTHERSIRLSHGSLTWIGGQVQTASTCGIVIDGTNVLWVDLRDVIMEDETVSIDGTTNWPDHGVSLDHVTLQGATATVRMGINQSLLRATLSRFNNGDIIPSGESCEFHDDHCVFAFGAAWAPTGLYARRVKLGLNGWEINQYPGISAFQMGDVGAAAMDVGFSRTAAGVWGTANSIRATDGLGGKYVAGAGKTNLADGDFTVTPANGATGVAHNTTDGKSYHCARANGTWKSVEVA